MTTAVEIVKTGAHIFSIRSETLGPLVDNGLPLQDPALPVLLFRVLPVLHDFVGGGAQTSMLLCKKYLLPSQKLKFIKIRVGGLAQQ